MHCQNSAALPSPYLHLVLGVAAVGAPVADGLGDLLAGVVGVVPADLREAGYLHAVADPRAGQELVH